MAVASSRPRALRILVTWLTHLANGWLYLGIALAALLVGGRSGLRFVLGASIAVSLAFCVYPAIKARLARLRPYEADLKLWSGVKALDRYSCPSGHCMTAAAVGIAMLWVFPPTTFAVAIGWLAIAWSRLSAGHHYPTDLIFGGVLGTAVSIAVSHLLL